MRERNQVDTSTNAKMDGKQPWGGDPLNSSKNATNEAKEPGLPINVPLSWLRWLCYSVVFFGLLLPFFDGNGAKIVCAAFILGHFASQLNALIKKP